MPNIPNIVDTHLCPSLSFVVPVKDERATLETLFREIAAQANNLTSHWEVIFIDDGSVDDSWQVIQQLAVQSVEHVKGIRFRRNIGKADALAAGWKESKGDFVFTMDADLQDDPEEIPHFLEKMREGCDIVTGWKRTRNDPWHKVLPSRIFNLLLSGVNKVQLHDHNCGFKCYRREVVHTLSMYGEMHRMVPSLAAIQGFRTAEIPVKHHPRRYGRSKYGLKRFLRGFLDMWTVHFLANFRHRPMHLMGGISVLMAGTGCVLLLFLVAVSLPASLSLLLSAALPTLVVGSILTTMIGLTLEWNVHQSAENTRAKPIAETIGLVSVSRILPFPGGQPITRSILVLDGDAIMLDLNADRLRKAGWRVLTASSCEEGRSKLSEPVDVVFLDLHLTDGTNPDLVEFIRFLRKASPPPEIIFRSKEMRVSADFQTPRIGALDYLCNRTQPVQIAGV